MVKECQTVPQSGRQIWDLAPGACTGLPGLLTTLPFLLFLLWAACSFTSWQDRLAVLKQESEMWNHSTLWVSLILFAPTLAHAGAVSECGTIKSVPERLRCIEKVADRDIAAANKRADDAVRNAEESWKERLAGVEKTIATSGYITSNDKVMLLTRGNWCISWSDKNEKPIFLTCDHPDLQDFVLRKF